jgi:hypothetical protein
VFHRLTAENHIIALDGGHRTDCGDPPLGTGHQETRRLPNLHGRFPSQTAARGRVRHYLGSLGRDYFQ